jgi:hypothetical protein
MDAQPKGDLTMAATQTKSVPTTRSELQRRIPLPPSAIGAEEHTLELNPSGLPGVSIRLALQINTRQSGLVTEQAIPHVEQGASTQPTLSMVTMDDGQQQFKPLTPYVRELVLSNLDYFFETPVGRQWGDISLLKAGRLNHRLISRIRKDDGFQTKSIDTLFETMNKALRGELNPEDYRNYRDPAKRGASKQKGTARHGTKAARLRRAAPARRRS